MLLDKNMEAFKPVRSTPHQSVTLGAAALPLWIPADASQIRMQALAQNVRYTLDGSTPTTAIGFQLKAGDAPIVISLLTQNPIKVMRETSGAILEYEFGS